MSEIKGTEHSLDHLSTVSFSELPVDLQQAILARMREEKAIFSASSYAKNTATTHEAGIYNLSPENAWAALGLAEKRQLLNEARQLTIGQQKQREEKHPIRAPAARPEPVHAEADRQFGVILEALYEAITQYKATVAENGAAELELEAAGVLKQAIKGNIGALEQRLTSANKAAFMALITKDNLGTTIATQLATIAPLRNASDSKSQKPISIDDLIEFLLKNYKKNSEHHANFIINRSFSKLPNDTKTSFGNKNLFGSMTGFLSLRDQASLARVSEGHAGMFRRSRHTELSAIFLAHVACGNQDQAEAMLSNNPALALASGSVIDLSKRRFANITAFQYALWAMDWHMWTMLLKYLPKPEAAAQARALEADGTEHDKHFSLTVLTQALDTYIRRYSSWNIDSRYEYWCKVVGGAQRLLPVHVVNEYCRPDCSFDPTPTFTDPRLPRTRVFSWVGGNDEWFSVVYSGGRIGDSFAVGRAASPFPRAAGRGLGYVGRLCVIADLVALQSLSSVRTQQLKELFVDLSIAPPQEAKQGMR